MRLFYLILIGFVAMSCTSVDTKSGLSSNTDNEWLIPKDKVIDGGPGKDGIPALTNPNFVDLNSVSYLDNNNLVIVFRAGGIVHFYPHKILDWHEIINDEIGGQALTVSYCPLTGTAIGLSRDLVVDGQSKKTTFGVSGLLYNTNLILYDRLTNSYWSQMRNQCVAGKLKGEFPNNLTLLETSYQTAKELYPQARVVSSNTDVYNASQYDHYPYGDYRTNNNTLLFSVSNDDTRLPRKERILGIVENNASKAYRFSSFGDTNSVITDQVGGIDVVIAGNQTKGVMLAFTANWVGGQKLSFNAVNDVNVPAVFLKDNLGNQYDILGFAVTGPDAGKQLQQVHTYISYWFAWGAFHPETDIYQ